MGEIGAELYEGQNYDQGWQIALDGAKTGDVYARGQNIEGISPCSTCMAAKLVTFGV